MKLKLLPLGIPAFFVAQLVSAETLSVRTGSANFREQPHEAAKIKFTADQFYPVEIVERQKGWAKVLDFEGDSAWVTEKVLGKQRSVVISVDRANIREQPNTTSDVLFKVERGEVFKIAEQKGEWINVIDLKGDGGWIRSDMTWGEPALEKPTTVEPPQSLGKAGALPTTDGKSVEKPEAQTTPKAKLPPAEAVDAKAKPAATEPAVEMSLKESETLELLCRVYLEDAKKSSPAAAVVVEKVDKKVDVKAKPAASPKKAEKKAASKPQKKADAKPQK